jgi:hypothetical protein
MLFYPLSVKWKLLYDENHFIIGGSISVKKFTISSVDSNGTQSLMKPFHHKSYFWQLWHFPWWNRFVIDVRLVIVPSLFLHENMSNTKNLTSNTFSWWRPHRFSSVDRSAINFKHSLDILWDEGSMLMEGFQKLLLIKRPISYWI